MPTRFAPHRRADARGAARRSAGRARARLAEPAGRARSKRPRRRCSALGIETVGRPDRAPPARAPRPSRRAPGRRARRGEEATVAVAVRAMTIRPMRDRRAQARRGARVRRERAAGRGLVQPALDRAPAREGTQRAAARQAASGATEFWVHRARAARRRDGGRSTPSASCRCIRPRGHQRRQSCASWCGRTRALVLDVDRAAARPLRAAEAPAGPPGRAGRASTSRRARTTSTTRARRLAFEELLLLQLALAGAARAGARAGAARPAAPRGVVVDRWRWSLPFELTADQASAIERDRRRPRRGAADAAAADGGGGPGKTVVALQRDAARGRERRPGRADGADGDARRAAPPHARPRCSAASCRCELLTGSTPAARRRELLGAAGDRRAAAGGRARTR